MKRLALALLPSSLAVTGVMADLSCKDRAAEKKLVSAALTSFMTKCEKDASASCDKAAANKKLSGAAKTSFTNKCVKDSTGKYVCKPAECNPPCGCGQNCVNGECVAKCMPGLEICGCVSCCSPGRCNPTTGQCIPIP